MKGPTAIEVWVQTQKTKSEHLEINSKLDECQRRLDAVVDKIAKALPKKRTVSYPHLVAVKSK